MYNIIQYDANRLSGLVVKRLVERFVDCIYRGRIIAPTRYKMYLKPPPIYGVHRECFIRLNLVIFR